MYSCTFLWFSPWAHVHVSWAWFLTQPIKVNCVSSLGWLSRCSWRHDRSWFFTLLLCTQSQSSKVANPQNVDKNPEVSRFFVGLMWLGFGFECQVCDVLTPSPLSSILAQESIHSRAYLARQIPGFANSNFLGPIRCAILFLSILVSFFLFFLSRVLILHVVLGLGLVSHRCTYTSPKLNISSSIRSRSIEIVVACRDLTPLWKYRPPTHWCWCIGGQGLQPIFVTDIIMCLVWVWKTNSLQAGCCWGCHSGLIPVRWPICWSLSTILYAIQLPM